MGMGSANFWIDAIMLDPSVMPDHAKFKDQNNQKLREALCPLVWDQEENHGFVDGKLAAKFFDRLVIENTLSLAPGVDRTAKLASMAEEYPPALAKLLKNDRFNVELLHRRLCFATDFTYDVVLQLTELGHALGIEETYPDFIAAAVSERLGLYPTCSRTNGREENKIRFRHWIIFNAREQCFAVRYGILLSELRSLIQGDPSGPTEAQKTARAHIQNAFSMCNSDGNQARDVDLHGFHGAFTPKFYPQRFALKDSIYSQRLDILALLIEHIIERYSTCLPPIRYCEFSVSVRDLSRPWIYDVLRSVQFHKMKESQIQLVERTQRYEPTEPISSFWKIVRLGHFSHLNFAHNTSDCPSTYKFTYKFLAGFDRQQTVLPKKHTDLQLVSKKAFALSLLHDYSQHAICFMMGEMIRSMTEKKDKPQTEPKEIKYDGPFVEHVQKLKRFWIISEQMPNFHHWIVGIDLFGDELGYPYCPFVTRPFIDFISICRVSNPNFGVRVHCGENVPFAPADAPAYRLFITHMYIAFCCLRFLKQELRHGIRIGHGIAFDRLLEEDSDERMCRKSSVLRAGMRHHAPRLFEAIAFEVNLTSNHYLLGQALRNGQNGQTLSLKTLEKLRAPIFLATDDDGVWPIDHCAVHPGHHSLAAEYCRAISTGLIKSTVQLDRMLGNAKSFCFEKNKNAIQPEHLEEFLTKESSHYPFVIHPDIVRALRWRYTKKKMNIHPALGRITDDNGQNPVQWDSKEGVLRVAFICILDAYSRQSLGPVDISHEYKKLFPEHNPEAEYQEINVNWSRIKTCFVYFDGDKEKADNIQKYQHRAIALGKDPPVFFYSPSPEIDLQKKPHEHLVHFLDAIRYFEVLVNAYIPHNDSDGLAAKLQPIREEKEGDTDATTMTVNLYSNRDKEIYIYHEHKKRVILNINAPKADTEPKNGNFIYVISLHGSAATAALHCLAQKVHEKLSSGKYIQPQIPLPAEDPMETPLAQMAHDAVGRVQNVRDYAEYILESSSEPPPKKTKFSTQASLISTNP